MSLDATLLVLAPELADITEADRAAVAQLAALSVGTAFGDKQELATAYLTAHMLTMRGRAGVGGSVKSLKEGDLSLTYSGSMSDDALSNTSYGQEYCRLKAECVFSARTRSV